MLFENWVDGRVRVLCKIAFHLTSIIAYTVLEIPFLARPGNKTSVCRRKAELLSVSGKYGCRCKVSTIHYVIDYNQFGNTMA